MFLTPNGQFVSTWLSSLYQCEILLAQSNLRFLRMKFLPSFVLLQDKILRTRTLEHRYGQGVGLADGCKKEVQTLLKNTHFYTQFQAKKGAILKGLHTVIAFCTNMSFAQAGNGLSPWFQFGVATNQFSFSSFYAHLTTF